MKINNIIKPIDDIVAAGIEARVFAGATAGVSGWESEAKWRLVRSAGTTQYEGGSAVDAQTVFDLASLTKPLATTLLALALIKSGKLHLEQSLAGLLPEAPPDKKTLTIRQLLSHSSGLPAHRPYHLLLADRPQGERAAFLRQMIMAEPLEYLPGGRSLYSDLGFILLGMIVEQVAGQSLARCFTERIAVPLSLENELFFNQHGKIREKNYAATEFCPWRGRVLRGEVSDENCYALGGAAGHAGLFGTIGGVLTLVEAIRDSWLGRALVPALDSDLLRIFLARQPIPGSTWALGFDTPSRENSSAGRYFSSTSVGHLGFTGTSFWIDPKCRLCVVLLTNRVHPSRENNGIKSFRPRFHDAVIKGLGILP